jgi:hypothetical protein
MAEIHQFLIKSFILKLWISKEMPSLFQLTIFMCRTWIQMCRVLTLMHYLFILCFWATAVGIPKLPVFQHAILLNGLIDAVDALSKWIHLIITWAINTQVAVTSELQLMTGDHSRRDTKKFLPPCRACCIPSNEGKVQSETYIKVGHSSIRYLSQIAA